MYYKLINFLEYWSRPTAPVRTFLNYTVFGILLARYTPGLTPSQAGDIAENGTTLAILFGFLTWLYGRFAQK
jgi:hypothetical protein